MRVAKIERGFSTITLEVDERDIGRLESGIKKLLEHSPNSDPLIDLLYEFREIREKLDVRY